MGPAMPSTIKHEPVKLVVSSSDQQADDEVVYGNIDNNDDEFDEWDDDDDLEDANSSSEAPRAHKEVKIGDDALKCRHIADEYCKMEEKQAKLCMILANNVYKKLDDENKQQKLCDQDDLIKLFYCCIETEKLAQLIHKQIAMEIRERLNNWAMKPYFGDILLKYYHYYKLYKPILQRYSTAKETLVELLKNKRFASCLQKIMVIRLME
jgi:hypothetical protein